MRRLFDERGLAVAVGVFSLLVAATVVLSTVTLARVSDLADRTTGSLCTLRQDLETRVESGNEFLRKHPHGIPGIPAKTLRTSIDGQRRTIGALSDLHC